jgi:hypothetical protein
MVAISNLMSHSIINPSDPSQRNVSHFNDQARFAQLQQALTEGWRIETPIYFRAQWFTGDQKKEGYYCILKRHQEIDLIVVPDSAEMRQFVKEQRLKVVAA